MKLDNIYVINLKNRTDRWDAVQKAFQGTGLKLQRWEAVDGRQLSDEYIKSVTSAFCNLFCSPSMIGCWLSHYSLWKHIADKGLNNVLILEDDAVPINDFSNKLERFGRDIPQDYDIIFLGCSGSCDAYPTYPLISKFVFGENKKVEGNDNLMTPAFPLMTHAYLVSNKGAKKFIADESMKKVRYHLDDYLAKFIFNQPDKDIRMYAFTPNLVKQDEASPSDNRNDSHSLITKIVETLPSSEQMSVSGWFSTVPVYIRPLGIPITCITIYLIVLWILLNMIPNDTIRKTILTLILLYEAYELSISTNQTKSRVIGFEVLVMFVIFLIFCVLRNGKL